MKKIFSLVLSLAMIASLGITPVLAQEVTPKETNRFELVDMSIVETGTYRVTATDKPGGYLIIEDNQGNLVDFVIAIESTYGYIFIDSAFKGLSYTYYNVNLELVDTKDLGVSGKHIYTHAGVRDYDPIIDGEYIPKITDLSTYTDEQVLAEFN
ncbi:hypothetical protein [Sinanaerobacter sp. ZZT-01]|uniref:hypothetical protein n=1 Tax=Sinanaerobacter sp. ZZT-01 TaxID=3111540 RepID=UPI002D777302|nr:hypothetical protein [Sinanaerobacter sp. ZZT-01]WRR92681.1 hypothetical protein U5921_11590 [Sinanaerobacter sp. ZZT-01]